MAFLVEDGTGLPNSNSYLSVAGYRAYNVDRGRAADSGTQADGVVQVLLVRATDYLDQAFGARLRGKRALSTQALCFPLAISALTPIEMAFYPEITRTPRDRDGYFITGIPPKLAAACAEAAWLIGQRGDLLLNPAVKTTGDVAGPIIRHLEQVDGAVTEETEYADATRLGRDAQYPEYPAVEQLMAPLLRSADRPMRA